VAIIAAEVLVVILGLLSAKALDLVAPVLVCCIGAVVVWRVVHRQRTKGVR
jgi:ABC-type nickel/cobalt efflux system permease component RcnA